MMKMPIVPHGACMITICMGDSRICSRGFPEVVVQGVFVRHKIFIITTPTFLALVMIDSSKGFSKGRLNI